MVVAQGDVVWADLPPPVGSGPGYRRPVVVVQGDALNRSRIATVVCVPLTTNLRWADAPGNVLLSSGATGLPQDSVANVSAIVALDQFVHQLQCFGFRHRVARNEHVIALLGDRTGVAPVTVLVPCLIDRCPKSVVGGRARGDLPERAGTHR